MFATVALMYAGSFWLPALSRFVPIPFWRELSSSLLQNWFGIGVAITGLAGVFSSMMIYQDTRRTFWRISSYLSRLKHRDRRRPDELQTWKHDQTNSANPLAIWWRAAPVDSPARTAHYNLPTQPRRFQPDKRAPRLQRSPRVHGAR